MGVNSKVIRSKIKSIKNTKKITKAMEMVSAAKMRKAVKAVVDTKPYSSMAREVMQDLVRIEKIPHPLTEIRKVKKILFIVISSNRGLCGSFNSSVLNKFNYSLENIEKLIDSNVKDGLDKIENRTKEDILEFQDDNDSGNTSFPKIDVLAIGKKGAQFAKKKELGLIGIYEKMSENPSFEDTLSISNQVQDLFIKKEYDLVLTIYTNYISGLKQEVKVRQILPFSVKDLDEMIEETEENEDSDESLNIDENEYEIMEYKFEPSEKVVLEYVLPRLIEIQIYQAILESAASEHSSRMIAMKNAGEAAGEMIYDLTLLFNKSRQAAITQEISEIVGAANAIK